MSRDQFTGGGWRRGRGGRPANLVVSEVRLLNEMMQAAKEICVDLLYGLVIAAGIVDLSGGLMTADDQTQQRRARWSATTDRPDRSSGEAYLAVLLVCCFRFEYVLEETAAGRIERVHRGAGERTRGRRPRSEQEQQRSPDRTRVLWRACSSACHTPASVCSVCSPAEGAFRIEHSELSSRRAEPTFHVYCCHVACTGAR